MRKLLLTAAAVAVTALAFAAPASAVSYNVVTGFQTNLGPNPVQDPGAVWTYGTSTGLGQFALLTDYDNTNCAGDGGGSLACWQAPVTWSRVPLVAKNTSGGTVAAFGTVIQPNTVLNVHPGPGYDAVVRFTAQSTNTYRFSGSFTSLDTNPNNYGDGVDLAIYSGANLLFSGSNAGVLGATSAFSSAGLFLNAGDTIDFRVGPHSGNFYNDSTGLALTVAVPEPATWGLMIMGFGGMGAILRRRRSQGVFAA